MFSDVLPTLAVVCGGIAAGLMLWRRLVRRRSQAGKPHLDDLLRHLAGGPAPPIFQPAPDALFAALDRAVNGFFGLDGAITDAQLLDRFAAAEETGLAPEMLLQDMVERCQTPSGSDDLQARRMIVLAVTRAGLTNLLHRTAFDQALVAAAGRPPLLQLFVARTRDCMAENPYLYLDLPGGDALRAAANGTGDRATQLALRALARDQDAALGQDLQGASLSASTEG